MARQAAKNSSPRRVPKPFVSSALFLIEPRHAARQPKPPAAGRVGVALVRMLAVNDEVDPIERSGKASPIGIARKGVRHHAIFVGDHVVGGYDRKALDEEGFLHAFVPPRLATPEGRTTLSDAAAPCEQNTKPCFLPPCPRP